MSGIIAIIGRPNVGKSTLFNRLIERRDAIVDDVSGVTRDRHYGICEWNGRKFSVIDTGGYVKGSEDPFEKAIREQVHIAMEEADMLLFVVDIKEGVHPYDEEFASIVHKSKKPILLVANKIDKNDEQVYKHEFYQLGLGEPYGISAENGHGTGDLLDKVCELLPEDAAPIFDENLPKFAIVGRPNAGKSSIVNALIGKQTNIVTPIAGTTRDTVHTRFNAFGMDMYLLDTAGLRKKARVKENIEFYSTVRALKAIEECDVALLVIDAERGMEAQDLHILLQIEKHRKGLVILVNKWDLMEKETNTAKEYEATIKERILPLSGVPVVFVSAVTKQRVLKAFEKAVEVYQNKKVKIATSKLNDIMLGAIAAHQPPSERGRIVRIKYVTQVAAEVPTFLFFTNRPNSVQESYRRYLENKLRENFGLEGVPVNVFFREK